MDVVGLVDGADVVDRHQRPDDRVGEAIEHEGTVDASDPHEGDSGPA